MPMYEFSCRECGQDFQKKLPMSQSGETQSCPGCGSRETRKRISAFAVGGGVSRRAAPANAPVSRPFT